MQTMNYLKLKSKPTLGNIEKVSTGGIIPTIKINLLN